MLDILTARVLVISAGLRNWIGLVIFSRVTHLIFLPQAKIGATVDLPGSNVAKNGRPVSRAVELRAETEANWREHITMAPSRNRDKETMLEIRQGSSRNVDGEVMHIPERFEHSYGVGGPFADHAFIPTASTAKPICTAYPAVVRIQLLGPSHHCRVDEQQRNVGHQCTKYQLILLKRLSPPNS
uniref:Uncharacterized protein n=1 Tax=Glossina pallidipes TaxID=7398 RepID=A0A1B0ACK3_GLOPL